MTIRSESLISIIPGRGSESSGANATDNYAEKKRGTDETPQRNAAELGAVSTHSGEDGGVNEDNPFSFAIDFAANRDNDLDAYNPFGGSG